MRVGKKSLAQCALLFWATYFIRAKHKARDQRPKPSSEDTHVNKVPGASFNLEGQQQLKGGFRNQTGDSAEEVLSEVIPQWKKLLCL